MQPAMKIEHVIIDGSNIATEGRDAPSLAQLDEAVQAFIEEYSPTYVTVVVDATFPNRIDAKERTTYEDAVNANELITPPAGAIGRGDAFVLQIARRAGASILSNDSFQEFHGDHPWLFDRGRLIGGKPVPHVGWVFMERAPVRGPTSRRAVSEARKVAKAAEKVAKQAAALVEVEAEAEVGAAAAPGSDGEAPKPAKARRTRAPRSAKAAVADAPRDDTPAAAPPGDDGRAPAPTAAPGGRMVEPYNEALPFIEFVGQHAVGSDVEAVVERFSSHGAYVTVGPARAYVPLRNLAEPAPRSAKELLRPGESRRFVVVAIDPPRRGIDLALPGVVEVPKAPPPDMGTVAAEAQADTTVAAVPAKRATRSRKKAAAGEAPAPEPAKKASRSRKKAPPEPPPPEEAAAPEPAKKPATKRAAKKATAEKATARKAPAKKATAKRSAAEEAAASDKTVTPAEQAPVKKAASRRASRKAAAPTVAVVDVSSPVDAGPALPNGERPAPAAARKKGAGRSAAASSRAATAPARKKTASRRSDAG
jgi:hypothetical protein